MINEPNTAPQTQRLAHELDSLHKELNELDASTTREQIQTAVKEMVEIVDGYFTRSAFNFYPVPGSGKFNLPALWPEPWIRSFDPRLAANEKRVELYELFLDTVFSGQDRGRSIVCGLSNTISNLKTEHSTVGFYIGVLVGAKMMGASKDRLNELGQRLVEVEDA